MSVSEIEREAATAASTGTARRRPVLGTAAVAALAVVGVLAWRRGGVTDPLARFLVAAAVVVLTAHLLGALFRRFGQPQVVGEVVGGLLLGPSALGLLWPAGQQWLFTAPVRQGLGSAADLGLVVFMFLVGCRIRPEELRVRGGALLGLGVGSLLLPFLGGVGLALLLGDRLADGTRSAAETLFLGLALSVTALPVLARILAELRLTDHPHGQLALGAAALGDAIGWGALTVLLAVLGGGPAQGAALTVAALLALLPAVHYGLRPALAALVDWAEREPSSRTGQLLAGLLAGLLALAALTQWFGLHPVVGALLFGAATPGGHPAVRRICGQLEGFTSAVLLPLFFVGVGLRTSAGAVLGDPGGWLLLLAVLAVAVGGKLLGAVLGTSVAGVPAGDGLRLGVLMNCRGVTELVVITIGHQAGLVNDLGATVLVLMAVLTTAATAPAYRLLERRAAG
ncbi:cation:proton antiporter [Kitasatospora sp. NPDC096147]|uniref:cation:proton antiporter n=1 Tax=Kitasatospora sp. NPDC096147 TaxID=3364093 RepID=UPI0038069F18